MYIVWKEIKKLFVFIDWVGFKVINCMRKDWYLLLYVVCFEKLMNINICGKGMWCKNEKWKIRG